MAAIRAFFDWVLEAIFPTPLAEREVFAMDPYAAWRLLPRAERTALPETCSIFSYKDERVSRLIWSIKYKKSRRGAVIAGYALCRMARIFSVAFPEVLIVPMPITRKRRQERGFNQCELMAREMERLDRAVEKRLSFVYDLLVRVRHTSRQTLKDRAGRLESARGLFAVEKDAAAQIDSHRLILVIDDVVTTGSTMREAIGALKAAGFERVWGLSLAH